jgi:demethylmenaquinone methyltransferase / 2-methoxy-6-polyprenyl-1,4-benzoquinol methylase
MTVPVAPHPPLAQHYGEPARRERFVRDIFDETAPWYDWATQFMSLGSGDRYRRDALRRAGLAPGMKMLDLAAGTGPVTRVAAGMTGDAHAILALDASPGMLHSGKFSGAPRANSVAERIAVRSNQFDLLTIGFALRHFADLRVVFDECHRVLRPGGRMAIFEITAPESRVGRAFLGAYMGGVIPLAVRLRTRSPRAAQLFRYYWETTRDCVRPAVILETLRAAGFEDVKRHVEMGIFSEYFGRKGQ